MENTNQQSPDQGAGNSTKGLSSQYDDMPDNEGEDAVVYAGLGVNNEPDVINPGDEEGTDTLLFTDTATARHATNAVSNDAEAGEFSVEALDGTLSDDEIDEEITELAEEEEEGNERY